MSIHQYKAEQFLPIGINEAWEFFSSPKNLVTITPVELDFKILSELKDEDIYEGMLIDYTVKPLFKIPIHWQTEIYKVKKGIFFTDRQLKGPYKMWEHTHTFKPIANGVLMYDVINYQLPLGILGNMAHAVLIKKKIEGIFTYRRNILEKIFTINDHILN